MASISILAMLVALAAPAGATNGNIWSWAYLGHYQGAQGATTCEVTRINTDWVTGTYGGIPVDETQLAPGAANGTAGYAYGNYALRSKGTGGTANAYWYPDISQPSYTIVSGDSFEYDIYYPSTSQNSGSLDLEFSDGGNLRSTTINDQNGLSPHANTDLSAYADVTWYHRSFSLTTLAGKVIQSIEMAHEADGASPVNSEYYVRNVRIVNGSTVKYNSYLSQPTWTWPTDTYGPAAVRYSSTVQDTVAITAKWKNGTGTADIVDLLGPTFYSATTKDYGTTYAAVYMYYTGTTTSAAYIRCGSDDDTKVWVNGVLRGSYLGATGRSAVVDQDTYGPFTLTQNSWYRVVMKVENGGGGYGLQLRFANAAGTTLTGITTYVKDATGPNNPTSCTDSQAGGSASGVWTNHSHPVFAWSGASDPQGSGEGVSGVRGYYYYWGANASGTSTTNYTGSAGYDPGSVSSNGTYYMRVQTFDYALNTNSSWQTLYTFDYESTPPTPGTLNNLSTYSNGSSIALSYTGAGDTGGSGLRQVELWYKKGTGAWTNSGLTQTGATGSFTFDSAHGLVGDGTYYFDLAAADNAGNRTEIGGGSGDTSTIYDNTAPTISIGSPSASVTAGGPVTYEISYGGENSISLASGNVTLNTTGTASGTKAVSAGSDSHHKVVTVSSITGDGTIGISIAASTASDNAGNNAPAAGPSATFTVDNTNPTADVTISDDSTAPDGDFLKGTVTVGITPADTGGSGIKKVELKVDSGAYSQVTPVSGVYSDSTTSITASWSNGAHSITVKVTDNADNSIEVVKGFNVNKNEVSGLIALQGLTLGSASRSVTFVLNGTITKTVTLSFVSGQAAYTFTDVDPITSVSAKTPWSLRKKLTVTPYNGQSESDFTGSYPVLGGDLNGDNVVNALDYSILRSAWGQYSVGDISGDALTNNTDYLIMKSNWYRKGDAE